MTVSTWGGNKEVVAEGWAKHGKRSGLDDRGQPKAQNLSASLQGLLQDMFQHVACTTKMCSNECATGR